MSGARAPRLPPLVAGLLGFGLGALAASLRAPSSRARGDSPWARAVAAQEDAARAAELARAATAAWQASLGPDEEPRSSRDR